MNNIIHSASLPPLPSLSLQHTANPTHHLTNILSNKPFPFSKATSRAQWVMDSREDFFYLSLLSRNINRDKCTHSHWLLIAQTQKIGISQVAASDRDTFDRNGKPFTPFYPISSTAPTLSKCKTLIQSLALRFCYLFSRACSLFQSF